MMTDDTTIAQCFVKLALALDQHIPGYVDAYFGPPEWQAQAEAQGPLPIADLVRQAEELAIAIAQDTSMDAQRRDYLARHVTALQTSLRLLRGETMPLAEETTLLYDITPQWVDEREFEEAHRQLDTLLPPGGSLFERFREHKQAIEISYTQAEPIISVIVARLRQLTHERFPLPAEESFEVQPASNQPWSAYNWYLGRCRSRIEINTDLPMSITALASKLAHEGYPGHHTELAIKETRLVETLGRTEYSIALLNAPSCLVAEGIAMQALDVLMPEEQQIRWYAEEILPRAGFTHVGAEREHQIAKAGKQLAGVWDNAAFLLHEYGQSAVEVKAYFQRYALKNEIEADKAVEFISSPLSRSYTFNYGYGEKLLSALFAAKGNVDYWFTRLLTEPVTPSQIREWMLS